MSTVKNYNYAHTNDFVLTIDNFPHVSFFAQKVEIPEITMGVNEMPNPIAPVYIPNNRLTFPPLTVTFKVDEEWRNWEEIFSWLYTVGKLAEPEEHEAMVNRFGGQTSDVSLSVLSNKGNPIGRFVFYNAFPETLSGVSYSTTDSQTAYAEATVSFRYTYFKFVREIREN